MDWRDPVATASNLTHIEWNSYAYRDIIYRRKVIAYEHIVVDITRVINPHRRQLDNTLHIYGERLMTTGSYLPLRGYDKNHPMYHFSDCFVSWMGRTVAVPFRTLMGNKIQVHCACSDPKAELHQLKGPANPPLTSLSYLKTRSHAPAFISVHVIDLHPEEDLMRNVLISLRQNTVNIASESQREIITHHI